MLLSHHFETKMANPAQFKFELNVLLDFVFPKSLQHPFAASRLIAFGLFGPLDSCGRLRSGLKGCRIVAEYELEAMCIQLEKEDIMNIYLHNPNDLGLLSSTEQEMIVAQADAHLKRAKGKAMLPKMTKSEVITLFQNISLDEDGLLSFHDAQAVIIQFRRDRVQSLKLVYPAIVQPHKNKGLTASTKQEPIDEAILIGEVETKKRHVGRTARVSETVAPITMFQKQKGQSNPDIIEQNAKYLNKHAFKINDIDTKANISSVYNVRLLREIPPYCRDPYAPSTGHSKQSSAVAERASWDATCNMTGVALGSLVKAPASSTTWKRKVT